MKISCFMTQYILRISAVFLFAVILVNCSDEEEEPTGELTFHSLVAEKDTLFPGEEIKVTAEATGVNLEYYWSATKGDILGSGAEITYAASPCHIGRNKITCAIKSGPTVSASKSIDIVVYE